MGSSFLPDDGEVLLGASGAVYAAGGYDGGPVRRLDPSTGRDVWATSIGDTPFVLAADHRRVVTFDSAGPELVTLHANDGTVLWRRSVPDGVASRHLGAYTAARAAFTQDGALLVGLTADGEGAVDPPLLVRLDPAAGETVWTTALDHGLALQWQAPVLVDGLAIVQTVLAHPGSATATPVYAIDVATGQVVWQLDDVPRLDGFGLVDTVVPGVDGRVHVVQAGDGMVTLDAPTGVVLWTDPALRHAGRLDDASLLAVRGQQLVSVDGATGAPTGTSTAGPLPNLTEVAVGSAGAFAVVDGRLAVVDPGGLRLHSTDVVLAPSSELLQVGDVLIIRRAGAVIALRTGDSAAYVTDR